MKKDVQLEKRNSTGTVNIQTAYSLRDFIKLSFNDINSKVFTFDKNLSKGDLTKIAESNKNIDIAIKNLLCMKFMFGEYIPKFTFF